MTLNDHLIYTTAAKYRKNFHFHFFMGLVKEASLRYQTKTIEELEGQAKEVKSFMPQEFLMKLVDASPGRLGKLMATSGPHIEF